MLPGWCNKYRNAHINDEDVVSIPAKNNSKKSLIMADSPVFPWKLDVESVVRLFSEIIISKKSLVKRINMR